MGAWQQSLLGRIRSQTTMPMRVGLLHDPSSQQSHESADLLTRDYTYNQKLTVNTIRSSRV